jgi:LemA protein
VLALWILLVLAGLVLLYIVFAFNRLVRIRNRVDNAWSQIDVQLRRRYDLIPNLVETVRGYAAHERGLFEEVTRARARGEQASTVIDQAAAENQITFGLSRLIAVAENYPDLKANENFLALQEELSNTESRIAFARQFYNDQVTILNNMVQSFPSLMVARGFRYRTRPFFDIDEPTRGPVGVRFAP